MYVELDKQVMRNSCKKPSAFPCWRESIAESHAVFVIYQCRTLSLALRCSRYARGHGAKVAREVFHASGEAVRFDNLQGVMGSSSAHNEHEVWQDFFTVSCCFT